ncbi:MAG: hypothetical protein ACYCR2_07815 [Thermoplasmataceae archaeon]
MENANFTDVNIGNAKSYLDQMSLDPNWWKNGIPLSNLIRTGNTYIPFSKIPLQVQKFADLGTKIYNLISDYKPVGGTNAFKYLMSELIDNMYQHSEFNIAYTMCQVIRKKKYVEICFLDNGISIPGNFERHEIDFKDDPTAIKMAVDGISTKGDYESGERGFGLQSTLNMYCEGAQAEAMVVSRNGIYYKNSKEYELYNLNADQLFLGTIISIKFPIRSKDIEYIRYLS